MYVVFHEVFKKLLFILLSLSSILIKYGGTFPLSERTVQKYVEIPLGVKRYNNYFFFCWFLIKLGVNDQKKNISC